MINGWKDIHPELRASIPVVLGTGEVWFPKDAYNNIMSHKDIRLLERLFDIYCSVPASVSEEGSWLLDLFQGGSQTNHGKELLKYLIDFLIETQKDKIVMDNPWCMKCVSAGVRNQKSCSRDFYTYQIEWVVCPVCFEDKHLKDIQQSIGYLAIPQVTEANSIYTALWDPISNKAIHIEHQFDLLEIHPGLGDQLDWALTAVVTALQNTSRGVPPIHLHTDEPLIENTRRLIAPYLNERSA